MEVHPGLIRQMVHGSSPGCLAAFRSDEAFEPEQISPRFGFKAQREKTMPMSGIGRIAVETS
jgi:hypothetical protein